MRIAPKEYGIGKWRLLREKGDPVGECWVRDGRPGLGLGSDGEFRLQSADGVKFDPAHTHTGMTRRRSFRDRSVLLDETLRDLEDIFRLAANIVSFLFDFISRRLARQDRP